MGYAASGRASGGAGLADHRSWEVSGSEAAIIDLGPDRLFLAENANNPNKEGHLDGWPLLLCGASGMNQHEAVPSRLLTKSSGSPKSRTCERGGFLLVTRAASRRLSP
jgi:hypothetical protein